MQGACSIRQDSFLSRIVAAEFEDMYNVGHRGRTTLFGIGVFGGSNDCWRRDLLERIGMDHTMLTEDIDSSLRATRLGAVIGYSSYLSSSEESPATECTLRKQRLRWAQGWTEVSLKHLVPLMFCQYTSFRQRLGFFTLLAWREVFVYLTFHPLILILVYVNRGRDVTLELLFIAAGSAIFSVGLLRTFVAWLLSRGEVSNSASTFLLYAVAQLGWLIYLNWLQVLPHAMAPLC
jgi:cellulose synthase/poly-beta-1,6-N-acetylglucosamine synthase-like glycosyltransferase